MRRRSRAGDKRVKSRRKSATVKHRNAPNVTRNRGASIPGQETVVARLTRERDEALLRETANAEILSSLSGSIADTRPVFEAILRNLLRLFGTRFAVVVLIPNDMLELVGFKGDPGFEKLAERYPVPLDDRTLVGKAIITGQVLQLVPIVGNPEAPQISEQVAREFDFNAMIAVPLI